MKIFSSSDPCFVKTKVTGPHGSEYHNAFKDVDVEELKTNILDK